MNTRSVGRPLVLAVAGVSFGWGSAGKIDSVLRALRALCPVPPRVVGLSTDLGRPLLAGSGIDRWYEVKGTDTARIAEIVRAEGIRAGLCVLDGPTAKSLETAGVPAVFLDSLPFLWSEGDLAWLPLEAAAYCAQRSPRMGEESRAVVESAKRLRWVDAVVPPIGPAERTADGPSQAAAVRTAEREGTRTPGRPRKALVSLGWMQAPGLPEWRTYPRAVIPAVLRALADCEAAAVRVAGNLTPDMIDELAAQVPEGLAVEFGPLVHDDFVATMDRSDLLLTSPGLTTLLEASTYGVPTVTLPPQNVSQIFNARFHQEATGSDTRLAWPVHVFDEEAVIEARRQGEAAAHAVVHGGMAQASRLLAPLQDELRSRVVIAVRRAGGADVDWRGLATAMGKEGAAQVAEEILAAVGPSGE
ncbi:hydroxymethylcytosylglucuronate/cytosylglucuronate synthase [Streptomyces aquilus]|uniref:Hydroxymethylcytosylglucuronate/cytosylglucurona te synthase n=1 Tax=Streptomyces aquilus TaxID=2548456 RepID=A0A3S9IDK8_9ACTN|nr:hydroxymethylcytosylglucuronate/cytosylglucuronate synthase [Streptomyces aquilus]AZP22439.1 hydroxymethylcytosylglucuronate/cytosylglucuronate synthase [Streptomyces aquilus]